MIYAAPVKPQARLLGPLVGGRSHSIAGLGLDNSAEFAMTMDIARSLMIVLGVTWLIYAVRKGRR